MSLRILLVEDEPDIRLIAQAALMRAGFQVVTAENGLQALAEVAKEPPDLVLLDCMLPELDGFETCTCLKANPDTAQIPIVFLTAKSGSADRSRCLALGAIGCITKPFKPLQLGREVQELMASHDARTNADIHQR